MNPISSPDRSLRAAQSGRDDGALAAAVVDQELRVVLAGATPVAMEPRPELALDPLVAAAVMRAIDRHDFAAEPVATAAAGRGRAVRVTRLCAGPMAYYAVVWAGAARAAELRLAS